MRHVPVLFFAAASSTSAQPAPPDYGFNFITIGDAGNPAYDGFDLFGLVSGRGSVGYEYRIAQTEVTSAQFAEFLNAWDSSGGGFGVIGAFYWGGFYDGSQWTVVPGKELNPVGGISWREAAIFTNWLHNGKPTNDLSGFLSGAYDTSTFTSRTDEFGFNDQTTRSPGARYWIPSLDEWIKAAHYDPDKNGKGSGGWWLYSDGSDTQPVPGMPGVGETSAGVGISNPEAFDRHPADGLPGDALAMGPARHLGRGRGVDRGVVYDQQPGRAGASRLAGKLGRSLRLESRGRPPKR